MIVGSCTGRRYTEIGFSLIELLVAMIIGLTLTLSISSVMIKNESNKRSTTSVSDIDQAGSYSTYVLDRIVRSAGSGYAQNWRDAFACTLSASLNNTQILPRATAWTNFPNLQQSMILAPVLIGKSQADTTGAAAQVRGDLITVMGGTGAFAESPQVLQSVTTSSPLAVNVSSIVGYRPGDLVLLADSAVQGCMLQQIGTPGASGTLPITAGNSVNYVNNTSSPVQLSNFGSTSFVVQLGNVLTNNPPQFQTFGVSGNNVLTSYDLLQAQPNATDAPAEISEGVVEMRALYGTDGNGTVPATGKVTNWVDPVVGSGYEIGVLLNASNRAAVQRTLRSIVAIRIGLILRTSLPEKSAIPQATTLTLFSDLPAAVQQTRTLSTAELNYRFKTVEVTIPLRNVPLATSPP